MTPHDRTELERLMHAMANGETAALFLFRQRFREPLARVINMLLRDLNRRDVGRNHDDFEFLIDTAALVVLDRAPGWKTDSALPWVWAHRGIRSEVINWLGHPTTVFDSEAGVPVPASTKTDDIDLDELAIKHPEVERWVRWVHHTASERDARVHLEYQTQKHLGDRSPAHTVATMFDLSPSNVRQIDCRVRHRLARLGYTPAHLSETRAEQ